MGLLDFFEKKNEYAFRIRLDTSPEIRRYFEIRDGKTYEKPVSVVTEHGDQYLEFKLNLTEKGKKQFDESAKKISEMQRVPLYTFRCDVCHDVYTLLDFPPTSRDGIVPAVAFYEGKFIYRCQMCVNRNLMPNDSSAVTHRREQDVKQVVRITKSVLLNPEVLLALEKESPTNWMFKFVKNPEEFSLRSLALTGFLAGEYQKAIDCCEKGLKINPRSPYLLYFRGRLKGDIGDLKEGLADLDKVIRLYPTFSDAFMERGFIKAKKGDQTDAEKDYAIAIDLEPGLAEQIQSFRDQVTRVSTR